MINDGIMACDDAWAAGLFDGEGTVGVTLRGSRQLPRIFFALGMTDRDVVERFAQWAGGLTVVERQRALSHYKTQYYVQLTDWQKIEPLYLRMKPWLGSRRREQFESAIAAMSEKADNPRHHNPDGSCLKCRSPSGSCTHCATTRNRRYRLARQEGGV